jgi:ATP-binding cassette subfamily B protein
MPNNSERIKFFHQEKPYSCAAACLRMVAATIGIERTEAEIRQLCRTDFRGTYIDDLVSAARQLGLHAEKRNANIAELTAAEYAIVYLDMFPISGIPSIHAVVVKEVSDTITVMDPNVGERLLPLEQFRQAWSLCRNLSVLIR